MPYKNQKSPEAVASLQKRKKKYGMSLRGKFATRFNLAKARCNGNTKNKDYYFYKNVDMKWLSLGAFSEDMWDSFVKHVKNNGVSNTTLERIDAKGPYSKKNCRWATRQEQSKNRRDTVFVTYNGKTKCLQDWSREKDISRSTLHHRIFKMLWSTEKALTTPTK